MKTRVITALSLLSLLGVIVWQINTPILHVVVATFSAIAAYEIMKCAEVKNKFIIVYGCALAAIIPFFAEATALEPIVKTEVWFKVIHAVPTFVEFTVIIIVFFIAMLKGYDHTKFEDVAVSIVASVIVPSGFAVFVHLRDIIGYKTQLGVYLIFYALICALGTDTGAQLGGMAFGKNKMCPNISPKKTLEGAACGIVVGLIMNAIALVLYNKFAYFPLTKIQATVLMVAAPFIGFIGMLGDLTASVLKRNFGVKDFGNIFPGHGGVMDRFDSVLFTVPVTYCVALFIV